MPLSDAVTAFLEAAPFGQDPLPLAIRDYLKARLGDVLPGTVLDDVSLPPHLLCHVRVVDGAGTELASGHDLAPLRTQLGEAATPFTQAGPALARRGVSILAICHQH
jgi:ATP-dependent helicase HrpA